ncbi:MAG: DNA mismatch repair endonuclease MutL [Chitinophagaceae bacterium]|nr:MAG: DNA mismatch repair endonuclease MutL [Chitinophagaceae bacterium]
MPDIIQLLPDHIANQIAAGEVIQRPASAVKELMENAVDSGATEIQLILKDAGKELVQVIDNGCGMSETDARMCFERHATSKINKIEDLFHVRTMGFRGEALASIAAVSQVILKTRKHENDLGTLLEIENSEVKKQEPCSCPTGTNISMKNLFFSVPARRHFLKSNTAEMRHIVDEFMHVALARPGITFSLSSNGQDLFHLRSGTVKQRILQLWGNNYQDRLVTVKENTEYLNVSGFVGKPETAKKTRGDQYFFVNNRFIKSGYLHHAIMNAFSDLIPSDSYPMYALYIELDPARVDINVHPTKQEIKFEDERLIYAFIQSSVKHALARFSITPALDFNLDPKIEQLPAITQPFTEDQKKQTAATDIFKAFTQKYQAHAIGGSFKHSYIGTDGRPQSDLLPSMPDLPEKAAQQELSAIWNNENVLERPLQQIHGKYILQQIKSGFILIDQQSAHERILYEEYKRASRQQPLPSQQSLFPQKLILSPADAVLLNEILVDLRTLGYDIQSAGDYTFFIHGIPGDLDAGNEKESIEQLLEQFKQFSDELRMNKREMMIRSLASQHAIKSGQNLSAAEMQNLIDRLFACEQPQVTAGGRNTFLTFRLDELDKLFGK